jgi:serine/threonine-protein kinase RIO1
MIHADLSEFNLLWHLNRVWVIDVGQSVLKDHPHALEFLLRDCQNITNFFEKRGTTIKSCVELFNEVTGKDLSAENMLEIEFMSKTDKYERNEEVLTFGLGEDGDTFDEMFAKSFNSRVEKATSSRKEAAALEEASEPIVAGKSPPKK